MTTRVTPGIGTQVTGVVTAHDGTALPGRRVRLQGRYPDGGRWLRIAGAVTSETGTVTFDVPPQTRTRALRLVVGHRHVHSRPIRLVLVPTVDVQVSTTQLVVTIDGGTPGDRVALLRWRGGRLVLVKQSVLRPDGTAVLARPAHKGAARYVVRIGSTAQHGTARARVRLGPCTGCVQVPPSSVQAP